MTQKLPPALWRQTSAIRWQIGGVIGLGSLLGLSVAMGVIDSVPVIWQPRLWCGLAVNVGLMVLVAFTVRWIMWHRVVALWQHRATVDDLTGLWRPGAFWAGTEEAAQMRGHRPWVMVYADLDDFKQINDQYGHGTGDAVLQTWGRILRNQARQTDILSRLGGEEVGWWLPHTTCEEARLAVERVLSCCQTTPVDPLPGFAFSAGLAQGQPGESVWEAARRADLALYAAKRAGKGRVLGDGTVEE